MILINRSSAYDTNGYVNPNALLPEYDERLANTSTRVRKKITQSLKVRDKDALATKLSQVSQRLEILKEIVKIFEEKHFQKITSEIYHDVRNFYLKSKIDGTDSIQPTTDRKNGLHALSRHIKHHPTEAEHQKLFRVLLPSHIAQQSRRSLQGSELLEIIDKQFSQ